MKKCTKCKEDKNLTCFSKNKGTKDGYNGQCKSCINSYRKTSVSKEFAKNYQENLEKSGEKFLCKTCDKMKTAKHFYTKRDYGKVTLNLSKCRNCQTEYQRVKTFGINDERYNSMLKSQKYCCKICKIPIEDYIKISNRNKRFAIDHCHTTGIIRGLLCCSCNQGLGLFKDNIHFLENAISYLEGNDMV